MDVERLVKKIWGGSRDMVSAICIVVEAAIEQDREEREDNLENPCAMCDRDETRGTWLYCAECVQGMITKDREEREQPPNLKPLAEKIVQIVKNRLNDTPEKDVVEFVHVRLLEEKLFPPDPLAAKLEKLAENKVLTLGKCCGAGWTVWINGATVYSEVRDACGRPIGFRTPLAAVDAALEEIKNGGK